MTKKPLDEAARKRRHRNERIVATVFVLAATASLFAFLRWNEAEEKRFAQDRTYIPPAVKVTPEIALLREYVRLDTSKNNETEGAKWLAAQLAKHGIASEIIESAPGRGSLYARIRGRERGNALMLLHHIDVVAAKGTWTRPPFAADIHLGMLYGRGTLDMKGIGICHLLAFIDIAKSGRVPKHDLVFLAAADEERGGRYGVRWLLDHRPDIFEGVTYALNEGGINEMTREQITYFGIEIGGKIRTEVTLQAETREQLEAARRALEPYGYDYEPDRVLPEVRTVFARMAPKRVQFQPLLADIDRTIAAGRFWELPVGYRQLTQDDVWVHSIYKPVEGWAATAALIDLPDADPVKRIDWMESVVKPFGVTIRRPDNPVGPVPLTPIDTPLFNLIAEEVATTYHTTAGPILLFNSMNDSRFLRQRGIYCYGLWPFPVDFFQTNGIHREDERVRLDWFQQGIELTRRLVAKATL